MNIQNLLDYDIKIKGNKVFIFEKYFGKLFELEKDKNYGIYFKFEDLINNFEEL